MNKLLFKFRKFSFIILLTISSTWINSLYAAETISVTNNTKDKIICEYNTLSMSTTSIGPWKEFTVDPQKTGSTTISWEFVAGASVKGDVLGQVMCNYNVLCTLNGAPVGCKIKAGSGQSQNLIYSVQ